MISFKIKQNQNFRKIYFEILLFFSSLLVNGALCVACCVGLMLFLTFRMSWKLEFDGWLSRVAGGYEGFRDEGSWRENQTPNAGSPPNFRGKLDFYTKF